MNQTKMNLLEDTFGNPFNIDSFRRFTREFFNEAEMLSESRRIGIPREYNDHINAYYTLAKYEDSEANNIIVLAVELKRHTSIDRARSMQRNFISKILDDEGLEAAIVAFYTEGEPSWRLSFVRLDYTLTEKGPDIDLTPARRYSYLVGKNEPNHTARAQLLPIFQDDKHNPSLDEIEGAFSVEKVTRDFFTVYKEKYLDLKEYLETNSAFIEETKSLGFEVDKFAEQFAKKLMGQLAFLYFLQKKGWLGVRIVPKEITKDDLTLVYNSVDKVKKDILEKVYTKIDENTYALNIELISSKDFTDHEAEILSDIFKSNDKFDRPWGSGSRQFIRKILWEHCERNNKNFFNDYLEPFFYDALNKKRKNHYFKSFNSKIPFLNGGLFEPIEGYHWKDINFQIPNYIFSNKKEKNRKADGILDIFDRFNFTINEAEPLEKDIAVDPEMLGKIFEELLEVSDRKSKGAFYTPREIVHYMCQESLINHLVNEVGVPYEDMKEFILYGELIRDADNRRNVGYGKGFTIKESILNNISEIDDALRDVRVADPAVGSGAFPLGMLNEIVKARNNITEYIIRKDKEGAFGEKYGEEFIRNWRSPYQMKLDTIKDSIFAVDIEPSAIDITKLRLWLSIVVDQEIDGINIEPNPLPNLDMNIQVGNSLIDEYEGIKLFDKSILENKKKDGEKKNQKIEQMRWFFNSDEILNEMFDKQNQYFAEGNEDNKQALKLRIDELRDQLIIQRLREVGNSEAIEKYKESKKEKTKPYFIWELEFAKVFKEKGGFDIVMGNPPYVQIKKLDSKNTIKNMKYETFSLSTDLYCVFFEKANDILKNEGIGIYITSNKWLRSEYGKLLRKYFIKKSSPIVLIDFGGVKIFETASVDTSIFSWEKGKRNRVFRYKYTEDFKGLLDEPKQYDFEFKEDEMWIFLNEVFKKIKNKVERYGEPLSKWDVTFHYGILTGANKTFIINEEVKSELINVDENTSKYIVPIYRGRDIDRYYASFNNIYLINTHNGVASKNIKPVRLNDSDKTLLSYFESFGTKFKNRGEQGEAWYNLRGCSYIDIFLQPKIIYADIVQNLGRFYYDEENYYTNDTAFIIYGSEKLKYLTGILNTKLISFAYKEFYSGLSLGQKGVRYKKEFLERLPIPIANKKIEVEIEMLVDEILKLKKEGEFEKAFQLEVEIDMLCYKLYQLTDKEIEIVENYFKEEEEK